MSGQRPIFDPDRMAANAHAPPPARTLTVSQLTAMIKRVLADHLPATVHLVGEISNFTRAASGHLYLTLKDDRSEIRGVMWRSTAAGLKFKPEDGLEVVATGHVDVYEPRGQYQFYIRKLETRGVGALELAFRQLHDRLAKEGLFDAERKRPVPRLPRRIGVVTSPTGAAIRDIIRTLQRRFPCVNVMLHPVQVQGEGSAGQIAAAIERLNGQAGRLGGIDLMIVGRGGGSLEDLWAFNEEVVARAIAASEIPVISAVGHEVDVTISDLVADLRAPTPTAAAELAVPVLDEVMADLAKTAQRLHRGVRHRVDLAGSRVETAARSEWLRNPLGRIRQADQQLDEVTSRLRLGWSQLLQRVRRRLHEMEMVLASIQPAVFLQRQQRRVLDAAHRLRWAMQQGIRRKERMADHAWHRLLGVSPAGHLEAGQVKLDQATRELRRAMTRRVQREQERIESLEARLTATSHQQTLARGFTITRTRDGQEIVTRADAVTAGDHVVTETAAGEFESEVTKSE